MKLVAFKDKNPDENRLALFPPSVKKLTSLGVEVLFRRITGFTLKLVTLYFKRQGAKTYADESEASGFSDFSVRVRAPELEDIKILRGAIHASFMDPFSNPKVLEDFNSCSISSISFEMIPRTTLAQKMDFLSSQANLAVCCSN